MTDTKFKAIIVGAGPVGLVTAHALRASGIDYVVLEKKPNVVVETGAGFALWPNTLRFLDQIGILEQVSQAGKSVSFRKNILKDGTEMTKIDLAKTMIANHGYATRYCQRSNLLRALYEALPFKDREDKIKVHSQVDDIHIDSNGVRVILRNGEFIEGNIVIGCDGVYSKTRAIALKLANGSDPKSVKVGMDYEARIQDFILTLPFDGNPDVCEMHETRSASLGVQTFCLEGTMSINLYRLLPSPQKDYNRYPDPDYRKAYKEQFYDFHLTDKIRLRDVIDKVEWEFLADQEQGTSDIISHGGRIVLLGDSIQKVTSITGLGGNDSMQSMIALVNRLKAALSDAGEKTPSSSVLQTVFDQFEEDTQKDRASSTDMNKMTYSDIMWVGWVAWFRDRIVTPLVGLPFLANIFLSKGYLRNGRLLDGLRKDFLKSGVIAWTNT